MEQAPRQEKNIKKKKQSVRSRSWYVVVILATICISVLFSLVSNLLLEAGGLWLAFFLLFAIILIGVTFDMVGVAVTAAEEKPFHAMASRKVPGAAQAIWLLRNADRVASFCNDVVGDICGIVSGAAAAVIAVQVFALRPPFGVGAIRLAMSALVAGLTVGGKAIGKSAAISKCTEIVFFTARILSLFQGHREK